jgi:hypothetical protein
MTFVSVVVVVMIILGGALRLPIYVAVAVALFAGDVVEQLTTPDKKFSFSRSLAWLVVAGVGGYLWSRFS